MATASAERELEGIWFLTTFLTFGYGFTDDRNPLKLENISYVPTDDDHGFCQVNVQLENGETWHVEVERVA